MKKKESKTETISTEETLKTKRPARTRKKAETKPAEEPTVPEALAETPQPAEAQEETPAEKPAKKRTTRKKKTAEVPPAPEALAEEPAKAPEAPAPQEPQKPQKPQEPQKPITIPPMQSIKVRDFCDLMSQGGKIPFLSDQQIQMLTWEDAQRRCEQLEHILLAVLDYDIVLSDTNIWLELLVGHSSSHSDPRVNARLQFERQLESLSKMMKRIGGRFMVMSETYEEIDRFATAQEPVNYKDADWNDEALCRNVAARLAKRLMLAQQKENRLRIEGIGSECHHASFADPAIIRRTVELFAIGKKVLLLTNDTSVGIRSLGMCDDLQRVNDIDDRTWRTVYEPQRPMVLTMDDLKLLDTYMRQYYYLSTAAGRTWMQDAQQREPVVLDTPLQLWLEGFRPGSRKEQGARGKEQGARGKEHEARGREQESKATPAPDRRDAPPAPERSEEQQKQNPANGNRKQEKKAAVPSKALAEEHPATDSDLKDNPSERDSLPLKEGEGVSATEETAVPEAKKSRSRRGGRGRRGKKSNAENA